jgi:DNA-directed RNA polymerase specialized sigma subunit
MTGKELAALCKDHEGLVKRLVHRHRRQWLLNGPIEDHLQVGRMALVIAAGTWKPGKGSSFPSWAHDAIRWELQKYDKVGSAAKHSLRAEQVREIRSAVARGENPPTAESLGISTQDLAMVLEPPEQFTEIRDHGACDLGMPEMRMALDELSTEDRGIVQALALGRTPNQIAKALKKDLAYVQAAMARIKEALS